MAKKKSKLPDGREIDTDKESVKRMFMASAFTEWSPFCASIGWSTETRKKYPVADWVHEKKQAIARDQAERIGDLVFRHRSDWHEEVLKTLKTLPDLADKITQIIKYKTNTFHEQIKHDIQNEADIKRGVIKPKFYANSMELQSLANAFDGMVRAKHRSLLIDSWSFKNAEVFSSPEQISGETKDAGWTFQLVMDDKSTVDKVHSRDLQTFVTKYYDAPNDIINVTPETDEQT